MAWTRGTLADWMGDRVVYRNLEPVDTEIPGLSEQWQEIGLQRYRIPRKTDLEYADAVHRFAQIAQSNRGLTPLERALFIGDTLMNDGTAAGNLGRHLPLMGFIGADRLSEEPTAAIDGSLMLGNRWSHLSEWLSWVESSAFPCDEYTALFVDLDKTSLGARGRNDKVIDEARVKAVERTMRDTLADALDVDAFRSVYAPLNEPEYHHFTGDNQDYLAYICLMTMAGICPPEELWSLLGDGTLGDIATFADLCESRRARMSAGLVQAQDEVRHGIEIGDPTPFKGFRRGEFFETVGRMDVLPDETGSDEILASEIVMTAEVASICTALGQRGVLVFGISDKPDEASIPLPADASKGYAPIHRTPMKVYGQELA